MSSGNRNVILLSMDALRADHLSCYGYKRNTSPNLDELADQGTLFKNAYSASSHTREAVPALLTGKYPDVAIDSKYNLTSDTIASTLSEEGFATAGFHSNPFVSRAYGFDRGFDVFDDDLHLGQHKLIALAQRAFDKVRNRHYARADEINERSLDWIDSLDDVDSFFLWNHYMDTHGPYEPPGEYETLYADQGVSGRNAQSLYKRAIDDPESITDNERQLLIDLYDAEIRYNDKCIGAFLDELRERQLLAESLLIVTADHGDAFGEHGYYEHPRYLHDEITHVPLFVRSPNRSSDVVDTPVSTLDVARTIEDTIGITSHSNENLLVEPFSEDRQVFSQARGEGEQSNLRRYAVRTTSSECYGTRILEEDSIEITNCTESSLREDLVEHIRQRIKHESGKGDDGENIVDDEIERRLEVLGYK